MTYKMFLDDERFPVTDDCVICRSSDDAIIYVHQNGLPIEIMFDHDLGGDDTSKVFIKWLVDYIQDGGHSLPVGFKYSVHSQNPIGANWIKCMMDAIIIEFGATE